MHSARRQAALPVPPAALDRLGVGFADIDRRELGQDLAPEQRHDVFQRDMGVPLVRARRDIRLDVTQPAFEEIRERHLGWLHIIPALHFSNQAGALDLRLALRAFEAVPFAAPLAARVLHVENDFEVSR